MAGILTRICMDQKGNAVQIVFPHDDNSLSAVPVPKSTIPVDFTAQDFAGLDKLYHPDEKPILALLQPKLAALGQKQTADIVGQRITVIDAVVQFDADMNALALVDPLDAKATAAAQLKAISSKQALDVAATTLDTMQTAVVVVDDPIADLGP